MTSAAGLYSEKKFLMGVHQKQPIIKNFCNAIQENNTKQAITTAFDLIISLIPPPFRSLSYRIESLRRSFDLLDQCEEEILSHLDPKKKHRALQILMSARTTFYQESEELIGYKEAELTQKVKTIRSNWLQTEKEELHRLQKSGVFAPHIELLFRKKLEEILILEQGERSENQKKIDAALIPVGRALEIAAAYQESHYVFFHGQGAQLLILSLLIEELENLSKLNPETSGLRLRSCFSKIDLAGLNLLHGHQTITDHQLRESLLSASLSLLDHSAGESALYFALQNSNISLTNYIKLIEKTIRQFVKNTETPDQIEKLTCQLAEIAEQYAKSTISGNLWVICVKKDLPLENFIQITGPWGYPYDFEPNQTIYDLLKRFEPLLQKERFNTVYQQVRVFAPHLSQKGVALHVTETDPTLDSLRETIRTVVSGLKLKDMTDLEKETLEAKQKNLRQVALIDAIINDEGDTIKELVSQLQPISQEMLTLIFSSVFPESRASTFSLLFEQLSRTEKIEALQGICLGIEKAIDHHLTDLLHVFLENGNGYVEYTAFNCAILKKNRCAIQKILEKDRGYFRETASSLTNLLIDLEPTLLDTIYECAKKSKIETLIRVIETIQEKKNSSKKNPHQLSLMRVE